MKKVISIILLIAISMTAGFTAGFLYSAGNRPRTIIILPNQGQLQQILNAVEPNEPLKIDYTIGRKSRAKWDRIVVNEYAKVFFTKSGAPK